MTPEEKALRDAFLAECWRPVPEVPRHMREVQRIRDREMQRAVEEMALTAVEKPCAHVDEGAA